MNSKERHEKRFQRRKAKRLEKRRKMQEMYGDFEKIFTFDNLYNAFTKCKKGVMWKSSTKKYRANLSRNTYDIYKQLKDGKYKSKGFYEFDLVERGKLRHIKSVHISERCVQRTLCDESLVPLIERGLIYDNGASMKNKGIDFALNRIEAQLRRHFRKYGNDGYILQFDFKGYFENIDHRIIDEILRRIYPDKRTYRIASHFVNNFGEKGLGLGSQVSQILAIAVPNKIDHFIKEELKIKGYGRYMDDGYLIHYSKEYLKECLVKIRVKLIEYGIKLNEKKTQIVKISHGFTFLKAKHYLLPSGRIIKKPCRKSIVTMRRKLKKFKKNDKIEFNDVLTSLTSWIGHMKRYDSYKSVVNMKKLFNELYVDCWMKEWREVYV